MTEKLPRGHGEIVVENMYPILVKQHWNNDDSKESLNEILQTF
jgi:hypothetical protein